jgi:hypothetical protein
MGRPKGTTKADARKAIQVRISPAERLQLDAAAAREGMPLSTWLRWLGLRAAGVALETSKKQGQPEKS